MLWWQCEQVWHLAAQIHYELCLNCIFILFLLYISLFCLYITYGRAFVWIPCPSKCMFSHRHQCSACHRSREIGKIGYILEIQDGRHGDLEKIVNIGFWYQYILKFPKIYRFPNLPKMCTKLHKEPDYFLNQVGLLISQIPVLAAVWKKQWRWTAAATAVIIKCQSVPILLIWRICAYLPRVVSTLNLWNINPTQLDHLSGIKSMILATKVGERLSMA